MPDRAGWLRPALALVAAVTLARIIGLWFSRADLFVDEAQYWLWGQMPDFGYYSKPPLIAWVIRLSNEVLGSDSAFAIRLPGPILHGMTALVLGAIGARLAGAQVALASVAIYLLTPFATLGSATISTDTVMAPFYALAILFLIRTAQTRNPGDALLAGLCAGVAFLGKYAAIYLVPGVALAAMVSPAFRPGWRAVPLMALGLALAAAPNVIWNLTHDLTTVEHTMDNASWVRTGAAYSLPNLAEFFLSQFAVFGPFAFGALILGFLRPRRGTALAGLLALAVVPLAVVCVQAFLSRAYANWALAAYFPGTLAAAMILGPGLRRATLAIGALLALALPVLTALAPFPERDGAPLLARWLGRDELSRDLIELARAEGLPLVATQRDILADLFHTGKGSGIPIHAPLPQGRPRNFYEQTFPRPDPAPGDMLFVLSSAPACNGETVTPVLVPDLSGGAYEGDGWAVYRLPAACASAAETPR